MNGPAVPRRVLPPLLLLLLLTGFASGQRFVELPGTWAPTSEDLWLRCWVKVPDKWATESGRTLWIESVTLQVNQVNGAHEAFVNGRRIGGAGRFPPDYRSGLELFSRHKVPVGLLRKGAWNAVAVRVRSPEPEPGFLGPAPILAGYFLEAELAGEWERADGPGRALTNRPPRAAYDEFAEASSVLARPRELHGGPSLPPEESLRRFTVADDLAVDLVLSEPDIAQPLQISFDGRKRMWVVEYRQYPYIEGVRVVSRDKYYRSVHDRVPPPPPEAKPGLGRVSIHEDTDGDGTFDAHKVFVDGLNLATSVARWRSTVFVLQPPYLLAYEDKDGDDIPDDPRPRVLLEGFGLQDTHSVANSLTLGPDGWLYAAHGSTTCSQVRRPGRGDDPVYIEGAALWRYHPARRVFEVVCTGGGNVFGIEIDSEGQIFTGHNGGGTRGFHYRAGGVYPHGARGKYGPRTNPYVYGEIKAMAQDGTIPRFSHDLCLYEAGVLPPAYHGKLFCVDPLARRVVLAERVADGSSYRTEDRGFPLASSDPAFRPVHITLGPDGALYIADFYEFYIAHGQNYQGQIAPDTGRIYRLLARRPQPESGRNRTAHRNFRDLLAHMPGSMVIDFLGSTELDRLWLAYRRDPEFQPEFDQVDAAARAQAVRLSKDPQVAELVSLAGRETNAVVRAELASRAIRLAPGAGMDLVLTLMEGAEIDDPQIPMLVWLGLERHMDAGADSLRAWLGQAPHWDAPLFREFCAERLMRRCAERAEPRDFQLASELFEWAPSAARRALLRRGFDAGFRVEAAADIPPALARALAGAGEGGLALRVRLGETAALTEARAKLESADTKADERARLVELLSTRPPEDFVALLLGLIDEPAPPEVQRAALAALAQQPDEDTGPAVLSRLDEIHPDAGASALALLASREDWARAWLRAAEPEHLAEDLRSQLSAFPGLAGLLPPATAPTETEAEVRRLLGLLDAAPGSPYRGKPLYQARCAACHKLFDRGGAVGPDLTTYQRNEVQTMLHSIVDPSAEVREGFAQRVVTTRDGRAITGFLAREDEHAVTLRGVDGQNRRVPRAEIASDQALGISLMPPGLLGDLDDQQIRDLVAYLRLGQPISAD